MVPSPKPSQRSLQAFGTGMHIVMSSTIRAHEHSLLSFHSLHNNQSALAVEVGQTSRSTSARQIKPQGSNEHASRPGGIDKPLSSNNYHSGRSVSYKSKLSLSYYLFLPQLVKNYLKLLCKLCIYHINKFPFLTAQHLHKLFRRTHDQLLSL